MWDDVKRVVTTLSDLNEVIASRPYNASENENADRVAAAALADANRLILQQQGLDAIVNNKAFLTIPTPTNAQVLAQVKALTRQMDGVIRLAANVLDATD